MGIKYTPGKKHGNADTLSRRICTTANNLIVPLKVLVEVKKRIPADQNQTLKLFGMERQFVLDENGILLRKKK